MNGKSGILLKIALPVIIGLGVIIWLFYREYKPGTWSLIDFNALTITGIVFAWIFMAGRDFGLTWRFRSMTDKQLSWRQSLKVTMLCEFSSAITPSAVGGSAVGMLFLNNEGIEMGRA
ncbi:MAG: flippase-like domain-containing protein, partial [Muribaculaceae bacterium]|nr:flippase-like domain-containing protein [Muribaculaceae bacterium]